METLEGFKHYLLIQGQEESTTRTNLKLIKKVLTECDPLTADNFSRFVGNLIILKRAANYIRQIVNVTRYYGQFIGSSGLSNYPYPKLRNKSTYIRSTMSDSEIEAFINLAFPYKVRNYDFVKGRWDMMSMFWLILAYTGMRPLEVACLTVNDVDLGMGDFIIRKNKTHLPRIVPIHSAIKSSVEEYVKSLTSALLFPSINDKTRPITGSAWLENFKKRIDILQIKRENLTPYSLRHSFASRLIDESSIYKVKTLMGHKKITTTEQYLHTNRDKLHEAIEKDPLGEKYKSPEEQFKQMLKEMQALSEKYYDVIYSDMTISEDGKEVVVRRKLRA